MITKDTDKLNLLLLLILEEEQIETWQIQLDEEGRIKRIIWGEEFKKIFGCEKIETPDEMERWLKQIDEEDRQKVMRYFYDINENTRKQKIEYKLKNKNGLTKYHRLISIPELNSENKIVSIVGIAKDITKEKEIIRKAHTDELTNLSNRNEYEKDMEELKKRSSIPKNLTYITYDINRLKYTNDTLGHDIGDELIIASSNILKLVYQDKGKIYRIGGDEFVIIGIIEKEELEYLKNKVNFLCNSYESETLKEISMSCGYINENSIEDVSIEKLRKASDRLMYEDKNEYYKQTGLNRRKN